MAVQSTPHHFERGWCVDPSAGPRLGHTQCNRIECDLCYWCGLSVPDCEYTTSSRAGRCRTCARIANSRGGLSSAYRRRLVRAQRDQHLDDVREAHPGWSYRQLADEVGCSIGTVAGWTKRRRVAK